MTNGFGGTKDVLMEEYAKKFCDNGYAAIAFDPRYFGESDGQPRQLFSAKRQIEDTKAAIAFARNHPKIDAAKIALWGTSASGGFGLVIASEDKSIKCITALSPSFDYHADLKKSFKQNGLWHFLRLFVHAQRDKGRSRLGMKPHRIPIVGKDNSLAFHADDAGYEGYSKIAGHSDSFRNEVCARLLVDEDNINPIDYASEVDCPALYLIAEKDRLVDTDVYKQIKSQMHGNARFVTLPIGHFDIYFGENFNITIEKQIAFFKENLTQNT